MRGRKLDKTRIAVEVSAEEIDNPRMRGRKLDETVSRSLFRKKKLIIPG